MGSCASINGIDDGMAGTIGSSKPIAVAAAGTLVVGAPTVMAGKGLNTDAKLTTEFAHDIIRATVAGPSRSRSAVRMVEKDPGRSNRISEQALYKGTDFSISHKKLRDSKDFSVSHKQLHDSMEAVVVSVFFFVMWC